MHNSQINDGPNTFFYEIGAKRFATDGSFTSLIEEPPLLSKRVGDGPQGWFGAGSARLCSVAQTFTAFAALDRNLFANDK
jgi:hypothetical protein